MHIFNSAQRYKKEGKKQRKNSVFFAFYLILDAQFVEYCDESFVETLIGTYALGERYIYYIVVAIAYHHVALPLFDSLDSTNTCTTCQNAVASRSRFFRNSLRVSSCFCGSRNSAPLIMTSSGTAQSATESITLQAVQAYVPTADRPKHSATVFRTTTKKTDSKRKRSKYRIRSLCSDCIKCASFVDDGRLPPQFIVNAAFS